MKHSMKLLAVGLLATVSSAAISSAMADPLVGPYVELGVGAHHNLQTTPKGIGGGAQWNYNWGIAPNIAAGYSFGDAPWGMGGGLRTEFEFGYRQDSLNHYKGSAAGANGGTLKEFDYMVNALYDFDQMGWPVVPHVGVGGGATSIHMGASNGLAHMNGFRPSVQGIIGAEYPIPGVQGLNLGIDYRYIETFNAHETLGAGAGAVGGHSNLGDHNFLVTLRYTFAAPPPPPPAPAPVPAAAPAPAPEAQRAFQVFFDFDKSTITAEAASTIQKASDTVKSGHVATINVTGHTDTVGSAKYNLALSQRRAAAVKQQLLADGIPASEIATSGVGKSGLLVPTPDGVREPQNRRAEIVLQ